MNRSHIGLLAKRAGSRHEYRIADKLSKAFQEPIRRVPLSGAVGYVDKKMRGDLYCQTANMLDVEIKFRRILTPLSVARGHKMIDGFIGDVERQSGKLLIVVTGTNKAKRKNIDWLFSKLTHAYPLVFSYKCFHNYNDYWMYSKLDDALDIDGACELFGIRKNASDWTHKKRVKNWESQAKKLNAI